MRSPQLIPCLSFPSSVMGLKSTKSLSRGRARVLQPAGSRSQAWPVPVSTGQPAPSGAGLAGRSDGFVVTHKKL